MSKTIAGTRFPPVRVFAGRRVGAHDKRLYQRWDKLYYILFGTTNDETDKSIEEIRKAVKTFKRK